MLVLLTAAAVHRKYRTGGNMIGCSVYPPLSGSVAETLNPFWPLPIERHEALIY